MNTPSISATPDDEWLLRFADHIARHTHGRPLLELGCGGGRDTAHLVRMAPVVALDIDAAALATCRQRAPAASMVAGNLARPLPFQDASFAVVVASLSIHDFPWLTTMALVREMRRCLEARGLLLLRVNSTNDLHYGAGAGTPLEADLLRIGNQTKRFFRRETVLELFTGWDVESLNERAINRCRKPKVVWEAVLHAPAPGRPASL